MTSPATMPAGRPGTTAALSACAAAPTLTNVTAISASPDLCSPRLSLRGGIHGAVGHGPERGPVELHNERLLEGHRRGAAGARRAAGRRGELRAGQIGRAHV